MTRHSRPIQDGERERLLRLIPGRLSTVVGHAGGLTRSSGEAPA